MSGRKSELQPFPHRMAPSVRIQVTGSHRDGGIAEVSIGDKPREVILLSSALFSVLAVLAKAALSAGSGSWEKAFVSTDKLANELDRLADLGACDPQLMHRYVYRLRRRLDAAEAKLKLPRSKRATPLGSRLIELVPHLGYRLSISPEQLGLKLLDDKSDEKQG